MDRIAVNGVALAVEVHGPEDGAPVLLLHGFPDSRHLWRHQVPALVEAGHRVVTLDQRGFGESDRPAGVEHYALPTIALDALGVLDALGIERCAVVGHDWGAAVTWILPLFAPERVERLCAISVGHPSAFFRAGGLPQMEKSWYMLLFLAEGTAEEWLSRDDWSNLRAWARDPRDLDRWVADLGRPGALTAGLSWYRANISPAGFASPALELAPITCPAMGVWSTGDFALTESQMTASGDHVAGPWRYERVEDAGHWVPVDAPGVLSDLLVDFLA